MSTTTKDRPKATARPHPVLALLPPVFAECLTDKSTRYDLSLPFLRPDGLVYSTDGRIAVRMRPTVDVRVALESPASARRTPDAAAAFSVPGGWEAGPTPIPDLASHLVCPCCRGTGELPATRPDFYSDYDEAMFKGIEVGKGIFLAVRYLALLRRHGAALYLPVEVRSKALYHPVRFAIPGGIEGVVMPMSPERGDTNR